MLQYDIIRIQYYIYIIRILCYTIDTVRDNTGRLDRLPKEPGNRAITRYSVHAVRD